MKSLLRPSLTLFLTLTILTGIVYPLAVTGIAQLIFSHQANGSLIKRDGKIIGSELIGQKFDEPKYFWGRLSATTPAYNAAASSGSNFGPLNPDLLKAAKARIAALKKADPTNTKPIPVDLVTASGSGLDPQISVAAANYQVTRVARARGLSTEKVQSLVAKNTQNRTFGVLGEQRVNVLKLNLALDDAK
jgi:K+-transporting ATPase ATPase C chain